MNREAIFCDETEDYRMPLEPMAGETVTFRLRAARGDSLQVRLATDRGEHRLERVSTEGMFDYYETSFPVGEEPFCYWFIIGDGNEEAEYNRLGFRERRDESSLFHVTPGRKTPAWAEGAVMYQIFVDRFCDGDRYNNVRDREYRYVGRDAEAVEEWYDMPEPFDVHRFYGGDLQGILDKLDYLSRLGVEVLASWIRRSGRNWPLPEMERSIPRSRPGMLWPVSYTHLKLRKSSGSCKQAMIRGYPNGVT